MAVSSDGRRLFAPAPRSLQIVAFELAHDGSLMPAGAASSCPREAWDWPPTEARANGSVVRNEGRLDVG
jgi:hypothetical protein